MSTQAGDVLDALVRAAGSDDPAAFDAAFDEVLDRARDAADPPRELQAVVSQRLQSTAALAAAAPRAATVASNAGVPVLAAAPRWLRYAKGLTLLGAGVAIGFAWGRSPQWWPSDHDRADVPRAPSATIALPPSNALVTSDALVNSDTRVAPAAESAVAPREPGASVAPAISGTRREPATPRPTAPPLARSRSLPGRAMHATDADSLRLALEQLRKAQVLLRAGEPQRALEALDWLDARVLAEVLQEEREVTRTLAWCDTGNPNDIARASSLAQRLLERAPDSAYAVSLRESCAGKAALLEQMRERTSNPDR